MVMRLIYLESMDFNIITQLILVSHYLIHTTFTFTWPLSFYLLNLFELFISSQLMTILQTQRVVNYDFVLCFTSFRRIDFTKLCYSVLL